jgi:hypothetical protein
MESKDTECEKTSSQPRLVPAKTKSREELKKRFEKTEGLRHITHILSKRLLDILS